MESDEKSSGAIYLIKAMAGPTGYICTCCIARKNLVICHCCAKYVCIFHRVSCVECKKSTCYGFSGSPSLLSKGWVISPYLTTYAFYCEYCKLKFMILFKDYKSKGKIRNYINKIIN